jgi:hypothetical protein
MMSPAEIENVQMRMNYLEQIEQVKYMPYKENLVKMLNMEFTDLNKNFEKLKYFGNNLELACSSLFD